MYAVDRHCRPTVQFTKDTVEVQTRNCDSFRKILENKTSIKSLEEHLYSFVKLRLSVEFMSTSSSTEQCFYK